MTTRKLSSEKLFDFSLFKNLMRRRLPHVLVAFLAGFFTMTVPIMMTFDDYLEDWRGAAGQTVDTVIRNAVRDIGDLMLINLIFTYAIAVYLGIVTLRYMMKRRSAHFYHALPERRETLYITSIVSALVCAAVGGVANIAISSGELAVFGVAYAEVFKAFFAHVLNNTLVFVSIYAITVFAGTLSGNGIVQVLMSLVITFYPLATYYAMLFMRDMYSTYFMADYFVEESVLEWLSPVAYVIVNYENGVTPLTVVLAVVGTLALLIGGLAIYKKRAVENSERPIVFKKLGSVLKYMFMFTITIFAGAFFFAIQDNILYLIFGFVCGAVLSFMLFNTILEKSPKAMFKNIKGLAIFAAAFAVYSLVFCFDVFNFDDYIPDADDISYAQVEVDYATYDDSRFDDPETLKALVTMLENQQEFNEGNYVSPFGDFRSTFNVEVVMHTALGPVSRRYYVSKYVDGVDEFLELYANDERMQKSFDKMEAQLTAHTGKGYIADVRIQLDGYKSVSCPVDELLSVYYSEVPAMNYETLSNPTVGYITVRYIYRFESDKSQEVFNIYSDSSDANNFNQLPVYEDMTDTIAYLKSFTTDTAEESEDAESEYVIHYGRVYDISEPQTVGDDAALRSYGLGYGFIGDLYYYPYKEIDSATAEMLVELLGGYNSSQPNITWPFLAIDKDYIVGIFYSSKLDSEKYQDVIVYEDYSVTVEEKAHVTSASDIFFFPKGTVPEEIKALFE